MNSTIDLKNYMRREQATLHAPLQPEQDFYQDVAAGRETEISRYYEVPLSKKEGLGTLSENDLQNLKYHFAITAAQLARACIAEGLPYTEAYSISDYYILHCDRAKKTGQLDQLHREMIRAYCSRMATLKKEEVVSRPVLACMDYIYDHLEEKITIEQLSEETKLSRAYLSRLFKKETGSTIQDYILRLRMETAAELLLRSEYRLPEIADALGFCNQSYFIRAFRKFYGVTPGRFRSER